MSCSQPMDCGAVVLAFVLEEHPAPGAFNLSTRAERHAALMERAAKLREGQTETVDAVKLINEARDELGRRGLPDEPEGG